MIMIVGSHGVGTSEVLPSSDPLCINATYAEFSFIVNSEGLEGNY